MEPFMNNGISITRIHKRSKIEIRHSTKELFRFRSCEIVMMTVATTHPMATRGQKIGILLGPIKNKKQLNKK